MIAYQKEKIDNAIVFFTLEHEKRCKKQAYQTFIYKYLAFLDFRTLEKTGRPALGLDYVALERGPVPEKIYDHIVEKGTLETEAFRIFTDEESWGPVVKVEAKASFNSDYFSNVEIEIMKAIANEFMKEGLKTEEICNETHKHISAWEVAWLNRGSSQRVPIRMGDTFENIFKKGEGDLTLQEERFLVHDGFTRLNQDASRDYY